MDNEPMDNGPMHNAARAEYIRLAAQAWSPSDAMPQVAISLIAIKKGSNRKTFN
jgi:hypothetical protein